MKRQPPIFATGPEDATVNVHVSRPFQDPWHFEILRPGLPVYTAECVVLLDKMADGSPHLRVIWKDDKKHGPDIRLLLERAMTVRLKDALPSDWDLTPAPKD
jgi:hypothetical protein